MLVSLRAASLNHLDLWVRKGLPSVPKPRILGADGAGVRVDTGERVVINPGLEHGDAITVIGEHTDGTHCELIAVPEANVFPLDDALDFETAAAFPLVFETAYRMLVTRAQLQAGEWVLIWGIGGGVATAAFEIARALGAQDARHIRVGREARAGARMGRRRGRQPHADDVRRRRRSVGGVDLVVETVGEATWKDSLAAVKPGGRVVVCGATSGPNPPAQLHRFWWKQLTVYGSTMGTRDDFLGAYELVRSGRVRVHVDSRVPARGGARRPRAAGARRAARQDRAGHPRLTGSVSHVARLHFGLILPNYGEALGHERLASAAMAAEEAGFDSGWVTDHIDRAARARAGVRIDRGSARVARLSRRADATARARRLGTRRPAAQPACRASSSCRRSTCSRAAASSPPSPPGCDGGEFELLGADFERRGRLLDEWLDLAAAVVRPDAGTRCLQGRVLLGGRLARAGARSPRWPRALGGRGSPGRRYDARRVRAVWHPVALPLGRAAAPLDRRAASSDGRTAASSCASASRSGPETRAAGRDERGRHAIAGPPDWVAAAAPRLRRATAATASSSTSSTTGRGLDERVLEFGERVAAPLRARSAV